MFAQPSSECIEDWYSFRFLVLLNVSSWSFACTEANSPEFLIQLIDCIGNLLPRLALRFDSIKSIMTMKNGGKVAPFSWCLFTFLWFFSIRRQKRGPKLGDALRRKLDFPLKDSTRSFSVRSELIKAIKIISKYHCSDERAQSSALSRELSSFLFLSLPPS